MIWTDINGVHHRIADMDHGYRMNCMRFMRRNARRWIRAEAAGALNYAYRNMAEDRAPMATEAAMSAADEMMDLAQSGSEADVRSFVMNHPTYEALGGPKGALAPPLPLTEAPSDALTETVDELPPCGGEDCENAWHCYACQERFGDDETGGCDTICPDSCAGCGGYHCAAEDCFEEDDGDDW